MFFITKTIANNYCTQTVYVKLNKVEMRLMQVNCLCDGKFVIASFAPSLYILINYPGQLSLAIPSWAGAMRTSEQWLRPLLGKKRRVLS